MSIKTRLQKLEASLPVVIENMYIFILSGEDKNKIIEFTCKELKIPRLIDESFDDFKDRAQIFFDENNSDLRNRIYLIQSLYSANVS